MSAGTKWSKPEEVKLSEVIGILNERFGTDFKEADQLFFDQLVEHAKGDEEVQSGPRRTRSPTSRWP